MSKTKRFVQWFGANTEHAEEPGRLLEGCRFVGIPFAGGMSEVPFITAKQILVGDLHWHIINLCYVVQYDENREWLRQQADSLPYHPGVLKEHQIIAAGEYSFTPNPQAALAYFVCVWMGRGGKAGTKDELKGGLPIRWNAKGGGSNRRYRTAIEALDEWGKAFRRCEFVCMDAFDFLAKFQAEEGHGLFIDAPWPEVGDNYTHSFDEGKQRMLADVLASFGPTRIVIRYGEHPLIRELYPKDMWTWIPLESRTQANERKPEYLICRNLQEVTDDDNAT